MPTIICECIALFKNILENMQVKMMIPPRSIKLIEGGISSKLVIFSIEPIESQNEGIAIQRLENCSFLLVLSDFFLISLKWFFSPLLNSSELANRHKLRYSPTNIKEVCKTPWWKLRLFWNLKESVFIVPDASIIVEAIIMLDI
jgi:hypothetical protein